MRIRGVAIVGAMVGVLALGLLVGALVGGRSTERLTAQDVLHFEAALFPLVAEGGKVVQQGVKVGIKDLDADHLLSPAVVHEQALAWKADLDRLRSDVVALSAVGELDRSRDGFARSLSLYSEAAGRVAAAAQADAETRNRALDEAVDLGRRGDAAYDEASHLLQRVRLRSGLAQSPDFPQLPRG